MRYAMVTFLNPYMPPLLRATISANILGCLVMGIIAGCIESALPVTPAVRLLIMTGFCGALTTMSSFVYDVDRMVMSGAVWSAMGYGILTLVASFGSYYGGFVAMRAVLR